MKKNHSIFFFGIGGAECSYRVLKEDAIPVPEVHDLFAKIHDILDNTFSEQVGMCLVY